MQARGSLSPARPLNGVALCRRYLHIGGVVAMGFDPDGRYLLVVSHAGRGVYDLLNWERVARDPELAYPVDGIADGIGPLAGQRVPVKEIDYDTGELEVVTPKRDFKLSYSEGTVVVAASGT